MRKVFIVIAALGLLSFAAEKYITLKFSENQLGFHWKNMETIKKIVDESNIPHAQAKFIIASIDSLQKDINKTAKIDTNSVSDHRSKQ